MRKRWELITDASSPVRKSVVYERGVGINTEKQGRRLRVASGATAPGPALEETPRFRPMSLSSCTLR